MREEQIYDNRANEKHNAKIDEHVITILSSHEMAKIVCLLHGFSCEHFAYEMVGKESTDSRCWCPVYKKSNPKRSDSSLASLIESQTGRNACSIGTQFKVTEMHVVIRQVYRFCLELLARMVVPEAQLSQMRCDKHSIKGQLKAS